jgi:hypothetical protein
LRDDHSSKPTEQMLEATFEQLSDSQKVLLARQLGYESFRSMVAASTIVTLSDGSVWWLTADRYGGWTAWNLCTLESPQSSWPLGGQGSPLS